MRQEKRIQFDEFAKASSFEAKVTKVVKGGLLLSYKGIEMFMPGSQVDIERVNLEDFQDKKLEVIVIENTPRKVVVSRRKVLEKKVREAKKKELETFSVGQVIETEISTVNDRGANVKLGHNYGFIHISEISHHHVKKVADFLEVGQKVTAEILEIDKRGVKLSIKKLLKTPWQLFVEDHKVGDKVKGKIVRKMADAMLVEIARDVVGIINKKDYSWDPNINYAGEVEVDSEVELQIISMDPKKRRMSLSKKHMEHMAVYGENNKERMTGEHETASYDKFTDDVANRGCSIRRGNNTVKNGCGYFEDRRPSSNCEPYLVTAMLFKTTICD